MNPQTGRWWASLSTALAAVIVAAAMSTPALADLQPHEADEEFEQRARQIYKLPQHCGRLVAEIDDQQVGLPMIGADYEVDVRGGLATVVVKQSFENPTDSTIEPIYEFPIYEKAAVYAMTMQIGERRVQAEIKRKKEAREEYEEAKRQGKQAALLDQDRPNLFVQRVANVEPGEQVEITLKYTHALPKDRGAYLLTVPLAVGERFTPRDMSKNRLVVGDGDSDPGATAGGARHAAAPEDVSVSVRIDGGMPVSHISSASHAIDVEELSEAVHRVELDASKGASDRHFRLAYGLSGDQTRVGVNSYWSDDTKQGYFDVLIEPPSEVRAEQVPRREVVFVVDRSGSMRRGRMDAANQFIIKVLGHLRADDHFRIIYFNTEVERFSEESLPATPDIVERAREYVRGTGSTGGTVMVPPLKEALEPTIHDDTLRMVVVVTDVKVSNEFEVIKTISEHVGEARMYAVGVGGDVNRYLLEEIGRAGRGFARQFEVDESVELAIDDAVRRLQKPVLTDISVDFGGLDARGITPQRVPDVFEGGSVRLHGQYTEPGRHTVKVHGTLGGESVTFEKDVEFASTAHDGKAVQLAWARERIADRMHILNTPQKLRPDELDDETLKEEITDLGLAHSLTTQWTSLVAVDEPAPSAQKQPPKSAASGASRSASVRSSSQSKSSSGELNLGIGTVSDAFGAGSTAPEKSAEASAAPKQAQGAAVAVDEISVSGGLEEKSVERVLKRSRMSLKRCYVRALRRDPTLHGELEIALEVGPAGRVTDVDLTSSSLESPPLEMCVTRSTKRLRFPRASEASEVSFSAALSTSAGP